ncbi:MAG: hypothetical protein ABR582_01015 [Gemmatimonadaceae bacterium]
MPKSTHEHQKEATNTDRKFRPDDEHIYARDKQEFQESEKEKREEEERIKEKTKKRATHGERSDAD